MNLEAIKQALATVVAIPVTPFAADGTVDYPAYRRVIDRLIEGGVSVLTPNGNTSEFYSLTPDESERVLAATLEAAAGRALVLAGVGHDAISAANSARRAQQAGAQAVMVHQVVHPYRSTEGWVAYHRQIAQAAPDVALVPYIRDAALNGAAIGALLNACPSVAGVKFAVNDPLLFSTAVAEVGAQRITWICGVAEAQAPFFWAGGATGFTSGLANVHPGLALELLRCLNAGDFAGARHVWALAAPFEALRARRSNANNVSVIKEALAQMGLCDRRVRPPISELAEAERAEVAAILATWELATPAGHHA